MDIPTAVAAALAANSEAVKEIVKKMTGAPAEQLGELIADFLRIGRARTALWGAKMLQDAGWSPKRVNLKVLLPIMDYCGREGDADPSDEAGASDSHFMQEKWAALLANAAADSAAAPEVPPSFPEILKQLSAREAKLLDAVCRIDPHYHNGDLTEDTLGSTYSECGYTRNRWGTSVVVAETGSEKDLSIKLDHKEFAMVVQGLLRHQLLQETFELPDTKGQAAGESLLMTLGQPWLPREQDTTRLVVSYRVTELGREFYRARQPPTGKGSTPETPPS